MSKKKRGIWKGIALLLVFIVFIAVSGCAGQSLTKGSTSSFDEESYRFFRKETHINLISAFVVFEHLMNNPLYTDDWESSLKISMASIKAICEEIQDVRAPEKYRVSHDYLKAAATDYSQAIDYLIALNPEQAKHYLSSGDGNYAEANRLLDLQ